MCKWLGEGGVARELADLVRGAKGGGPAVGAPAPALTLTDQNGEQRRLADYRGHWVVLYFYPKDHTPGCTAEACHFRDQGPRLEGLGARVLGVSVDTGASHAAFAAKHHLPFPLLADADGEVARAYGTLFHLGPVRFARRRTFIIDPDGHIARIYRDVKPATHSDEVVAALAELQDG